MNGRFRPEPEIAPITTMALRVRRAVSWIARVDDIASSQQMRVGAKAYYGWLIRMCRLDFQKRRRR